MCHADVAAILTNLAIYDSTHLDIHTMTIFVTFPEDVSKVI